jgi:molecular chaperone GrpE
MTDHSNIKEQSEELENQAKEQETSPEQENIQEEEATDKKASAKKEEKDPLTELQEKYDSLNDKYLRLYSEFENFRRRTAKEKLEVMKTAGGNIVRDLIQVIDDFERDIAANENNEDVNNIKEGFELIHHKLKHNLEQQGLKPMDAEGKEFDTEYHEAVTNIPAPSEDMKGKVVDVAEKGYFFHDNVLRYAKVIVGQ